MNIEEMKLEIEKRDEAIKVMLKALTRYAKNDLQGDYYPMPSKAHLYDKNYPMWSEKWNQRSMSDIINGKNAIEALARAEAILNPEPKDGGE